MWSFTCRSTTLWGQATCQYQHIAKPTSVKLGHLLVGHPLHVCVTACCLKSYAKATRCFWRNAGTFSRTKIGLCGAGKTAQLRAKLVWLALVMYTTR
eukprot:4333141-Amphidinium_carterae.1